MRILTMSQQIPLMDPPVSQPDPHCGRFFAPTRLRPVVVEAVDVYGFCRHGWIGEAMPLRVRPWGSASA